MALREFSAEEMEQMLSLLSQNFNQELKRMAKRRLELEKKCLGEDLAQFEVAKSPPAKATREPSTVRLEPSLAERLAESRGKAYDLEDALQETRTAFEDRIETTDRMRTDLADKEDLLVRSVRQIEECLRAVLCMRQEADTMLTQLENKSAELDADLDRLGSDRCSTLLWKRSLLDVTDVFRPARRFLEGTVSDMPPSDLVEYFLALLLLRDDLLAQGEECALVRGALSDQGRRLDERRDRAPTVAVSKENEILELKYRLGSLKSKTVRLEEEIDQSVYSKLRDDSDWYDVERWIKKLYESTVEIRPSQLQSGSSTDMLEALKDFVTDANQMVERLKMD